MAGDCDHCKPVHHGFCSETRRVELYSGAGRLEWPNLGSAHCSQNSTGGFSCLTGDCGSGTVTLAEFNPSGYTLDYYDVSLVDGFNIPVLVKPLGSGGGCETAGCAADLKASCPQELKMTDKEGRTVACKGPCLTFKKPEYCCTGAYKRWGDCNPTSYSQMFKNACPRAYSYAMDDPKNTFYCSGAVYIITFCPSSSARWEFYIRFLYAPQHKVELPGTMVHSFAR